MPPSRAMAIDSATTSVTRAGVGRLIGIGIASIGLLGGTCQLAAANSADVAAAYALIPCQLSMGHAGAANAPPARKRMTSPAKREPGLTRKDRKEQAEGLNG